MVECDSCKERKLIQEQEDDLLAFLMECLDYADETGIKWPEEMNEQVRMLLSDYRR